ncbi:MAG: S8 family serine peptidase [Phycisphaeraceae bacterium]|nr:S8 family serine peptidase [Phycisphaeraceae bacterium]
MSLRRWGLALVVAMGAAAAGADDALSPPVVDVSRISAKAALEADATLQYSPTNIFVHFAPEVTDRMREQLLEPVGGRIVLTYTLVPGLVLVAPEVDVEHAVQVLAGLPGIEYAEFDWVCRTAGVPNDPSFGLLWGMHNTGQVIGGSTGIVDADIDAPEGWDIFTGDPNFAIAVIDTGVLWSHPDLAQNIWTNPGEIAGNGIDDDGNGYIDDIRGWDFYDNDNNPTDPSSHGTHVAGTIGAVGNNGIGVTGVAWRCKIVPLRFLGPNGGFTSDAILAVQYCTTKGIKVSNNSWGGGGYSTALFNAINASQSVGHIFVCAAGNDNVNIDSSPRYPASYTSSNLIAVAATTNRDARSGFSNYGVTSVDLGAPGTNIYSTVLSNGYGYKSGTSMASPHVAGVVAMVYAQNPTWTWTQVRNRVFSTVRPTNAMNGRTVTGGVVNLAAALMPAVNTPPVVTITSPADGASFDYGSFVALSATAIDAQDGNISSSIQWSSNINGPLGGGANISRQLIAGTHEITATATDSGQLSHSHTITITVVYVVQDPPAAPTDPRTANLGGGIARVRWTDASNNEDGFEIEREARIGNKWLNPTIVGTTGPDTGEYIDNPGAGRFRYRVRAFNAAGSSDWSPWRQVDVTN